MSWRKRGTLVVLGVVVLFNAVGVVAALAALFGPVPYDWRVFTEAAALIAAGGDPYQALGPWPFRWSPAAAWLFVPITGFGLWPWRLLHLAALALLPRRVAVIVGLSFPFWFDVLLGNILAFAFVLAWRALAGSRWAALSFLALAILVPRPLMLPVAAWLLWHRAELRVPFAALFGGHALYVLASGLGPAWASVLMSTATTELPSFSGPTLLGPLWVGLAALAAALFTIRGRLGWASLAASPYWLPYYLVFLGLDLAPGPIRRSAQAPLAGERPTELSDSLGPEVELDRRSSGGWL